ncbi:hypothetical protein GY45DRAFT_616115 [Cubamyces sp. BRFM 1775]|nr:hypothetical protein GY45DRAFT_616115 [Cubamyces sp. BRFM 1775]
MGLMLDTISRLLGRSQDWVCSKLPAENMRLNDTPQRSFIQTAMTAWGSDGPSIPYPNDDDGSISEDEGTAMPVTQDEHGEEPPSSLLGEEVVIAPEGTIEDNESSSSATTNDDIGPRDISSSQSNLDPTLPEFVPSYQLRLHSLRRALDDPPYYLDSLRSLPPGSVADEEPSDGGDGDAAEAWADFWRGFGERDDDGGADVPVDGQPNSGLDLASLLLASSPPASTASPPSTSSSTLSTPSDPLLSEPHATTSGLTLDAPPENPFIQNTDPPFMTDGRGRVVASSTTSSRARDGRRGRAVSSSAAVPLPHSKPDTIMLGGTAADAVCSSPSLHSTSGLPQQRHARQRSLSLIEPTGPGEEAPPAEFVTDGRGRVVFASNS